MNTSVLDAVEKAQALVQVALAEDVPVLPDKIGHRVGRHLSRALRDLEDAYNEVLTAITLEDSVP